MRLHLRRNFNEVFGRGNQFRLFCLCLPQKIFQFLPVVKMMIGKIEGFDRFYSVFAQRIIKFFRAADAGKGDNFVGSQRRRFGNDFALNTGSSFSRPIRLERSSPIMTAACARLRPAAKFSLKGPAGTGQPLPIPAAPSKIRKLRSLYNPGF